MTRPGGRPPRDGRGASPRAGRAADKPTSSRGPKRDAAAPRGAKKDGAAARGATRDVKRDGKREANRDSKRDAAPPRGDKNERSSPKSTRPRPNLTPGAGGKGGTIAASDEGPMRVQRALARAGAASRREADKAVAEGRVQINGATAVIGQLVDTSRDRLTLDGKIVDARVTAHRWIVLHKPAAVMSTRTDPQGRPTVFDLVDRVPGLVYVGRLDFMTEGVLLLTTDGKAAHALTHPSFEIERTYVATVQGDAVGAARIARQGVELEDGLVVPRDVDVQSLGQRRWAFELTIAEGRTHEVRRLCDALGLEVERLVRTRFGPVRLGALAPGETRALTSTEREMLEAMLPTA